MKATRETIVNTISANIIFLLSKIIASICREVIARQRGTIVNYVALTASSKGINYSDGENLIVRLNFSLL